MIQGTRIKFSNEGKWTDNQGIELDPGKHYLAIGVERVVNKWPVEQGPPLETIVLAPGQPFPNIDKMNKACPKSEWREAFGKQVGPYKPQRLLYLLDRLMTLDKYTFPHLNGRRHACSARAGRQDRLDAALSASRCTSARSAVDHLHADTIWRTSAAAFHHRGLDCAQWW
jgi:hypothetical protein